MLGRLYTNAGPLPGCASILLIKGVDQVVGPYDMQLPSRNMIISATINDGTCVIFP